MEKKRIKVVENVTSATYQLFRAAMRAEKRVACIYDGHRRELCPVILGHTNGEEMVLAFQVAGTGSRGLPPGGQWKCLRLSRVRHAHMTTGPWREGERHRRTQSCVQEADIDINIHMRKRRE